MPGLVEASVNYVTGRIAAERLHIITTRPSGALPRTCQGFMDGGTRVVVSLLSDAPSVIEAHGGAYACALVILYHPKLKWSTPQQSRGGAPGRRRRFTEADGERY